MVQPLTHPAENGALRGAVLCEIGKMGRWEGGRSQLPTFPTFQLPYSQLGGKVL